MSAVITGAEYLEAQHVLIGIIYFIGGLFALVTHGRTIGNLLRRPLLPRASNIIHLHFAIANIGVVAGFPFAGSSCFAGEWLFGKTACQVYAFAGFFFGIAAFLMVVFMSFERYLAAFVPHYSKRLGACFTNFIAILIWTSAMVWALLPLFGIGRYDIEPQGTSCTIDWLATDDLHYTYMTALVIFAFLLPIGLASLFNLFVWVGYNKDSSNPAAACDGAVNKCSAIVTEAELNTITHLILLVVMVTWSPYVVVCTWALLTNPRQVPLFVAYLPPITAKLGTAILPLVYTAGSRGYRLPSTSTPQSTEDNAEKKDS